VSGRENLNSTSKQSANSKQHGDVLPHFREQRCLGFGMKLCLAARPVQAFELVDEDSTFYLIDFDGQREGIWFALARQGANYR
jgi:hypothetical protein